MKKIFLISITIFLLTMIGCKKEFNDRVTVIRDCTGTYLRLDGKDYKICNYEIVASFENNETITATFKMNKNSYCEAQHRTTCAMFHENEGWIDVSKVN